MTAALTVATTVFMLVGLVSFGAAAVFAIRLFWRAIVAALAVAACIAYPEARPLLVLAGGVALLGWGWERWTTSRAAANFPRTKLTVVQNA